MRRLFRGGRASSTLGTFLRAFTVGHVRHLDALASRLLINLTRRMPLLTGAGELAYLDVDDTVKPTFGYAKQGAVRGYTDVNGLNALLAIVSTASGRPVVAAAQLRRGSTISQRRAPIRSRRVDHRQSSRRDGDAGAARGLGVLPVRRDHCDGAPQALLLDRRPP